LHKNCIHFKPAIEAAWSASYSALMNNSLTPSSTERTASPVFTAVFLLLCIWFVGGVYIDGWAHNNIPDLIDSFFSPWHAILYSGHAALLIFLLGNALMGKFKGASWKTVLPIGYGYSLIGALMFLFGGVFDLVWHEIFGIEENIDALMSPSHLLLALGGTFIVTGPFRAWLMRDASTQRQDFLSQIPPLLSLTFALSLVTFMTQFAHFAEIRSAGTGTPFDIVYYQDLSQGLSIAGFMLETVFLVGALCLFMRHAKIAAGGAFLIIFMNTVAMAIMKDSHIVILAGVAGGIAAELWFRSMPESQKDLYRFRFGAVAVPMVLQLVYFISLMATEGVWWTVHLWTGAVVLVGVMGFLVSYLVVPPLERR
jgi:hypothetical protein